jgi:hypothetical protein
MTIVYNIEPPVIIQCNKSVQNNQKVIGRSVDVDIVLLETFFLWFGTFFWIFVSFLYPQLLRALNLTAASTGSHFKIGIKHAQKFKNNYLKILNTVVILGYVYLR